MLVAVTADKLRKMPPYPLYSGRKEKKKVWSKLVIRVLTEEMTSSSP